MISMSALEKLEFYKNFNFSRIDEIFQRFSVGKEEVLSWHNEVPEKNEIIYGLKGLSDALRTLSHL